MFPYKISYFVFHGYHHFDLHLLRQGPTVHLENPAFKKNLLSKTVRKFSKFGNELNCVAVSGRRDPGSASPATPDRAAQLGNGQSLHYLGSDQTCFDSHSTVS